MKPITNHPQYYVTDDGRVYSTVRGTLRELSQSTHSNGYLTVGIANRRQYVHRLVAHAYIPNPNNYPCVCHADDDKTNNAVDNLWWGTRADNNRDRSQKGRTARQYGIDNGHNSGAVEIHGVTYPTMADAIRVIGGIPSTMYSRLRRGVTGYKRV